MGKAVRAPTAYGQYDFYPRVPPAELLHQTNIRKAAYIYPALSDRAKGQVDVGQAL